VPCSKASQVIYGRTACPLDEDHFWKALRYVELNPVRAGLARDAWEWPWSSARAHITGIDDSGLLNMELWRSRFDGNSWKEFLKVGLVASERDHIRMATRTGRPLGTDDFVRQLEKLTGRTLRSLKPGPKSGISKR
jgi:putative transposase